jgi:Icc protein
VGGEILGTDTFRSLQLVLEAALTLRQPPELIVATGDLSDDGSEASYSRLRHLLLGTHLPVYVIPGNHDSVSGMQRFLAGGAIKTARHVDLQSWRLVFLNSKVADRAYGYLEDSEFELLVGALTEHPQRPVAVCLHHSPTRPCPSAGCHLKNDDAFVALLDSHENARVVVSGHAHLELERRIRHGSLLTTPATSSQCSHAQPGQLVDHEDFRASHQFDASRHGFRMLALHADGRFDTEVHWVPAAV